MTKIRTVALLLPGLLLASQLAPAQTRLKVSQVDSTGQITETIFDPATGPVAKAPTPGPNGTFKYWDGIAATDYYTQPSYIPAPPNPQIAVGPDDVLTVVNRTIARYPNPNTAGNNGAANPYSYPPTHAALLDAWTGIAGGNLTNLCPSHADTNTCVLDNVSMRYDQLQGRFVVLMTITDLEFHLSSWVLVVSRWANFACSTTVVPNPPSACPFTSDIFTPPIVANFGGPSIGGFNSNWVAYVIPINVVVPAGAGAAFCTAGAASAPTGAVPPGYGGTPASLPPGGGTGAWDQGPGNPAGTPTVGCTNYYPTGARFGLDNDNIILTAPVLDQTQTVFGPSGGAGLPGGAYAGTRVTTVPKLVVYNGSPLPLSGGGGFPPAFGVGLGAINLADSGFTGTLTGVGNAIPGVAGAAGLTTGVNSLIPAIFWEPDNLRGRALASYSSQVGVSQSSGPSNTDVQGVITPIDYLVGSEIEDTPGGLFANTSRFRFYVQPIVFSCPATALFAAPGGVTFCGTAGGNGTQVPGLPVLGALRKTAGSLTQFGDAQLVGQGPPTSSAPSYPSPFGFIGGQPRLFVGDSRPQQVIFREGLLYVARTAQVADLGGNSLGTSTVVYDILKQPGPACQTNSAAGLGASGPFCTVSPSCVDITSPGCTPSAYSTNGFTIPNPVTVLETYWYNGTTPRPCPAATGVNGPPSGAGNTPGNSAEPLCDSNGYGFYAPMYEVPASVLGGLTTSSNFPISPVDLFPWLEKLFVGMTTGGTPNLAGTFSTSNPSLWDFRPGDDLYDTSLSYVDPVTGAHWDTGNNPFPCNAYGNVSSPENPLYTCPVIPWGMRGGASTDPNDGSLWLYGAFSKKRFSQVDSGPGQWGTSVANYALDFAGSDPYGNDNQYFVDVEPLTNPFFTWIQIGKNLGIAVGKVSGPTLCPSGINGIIPPPGSNNSGTSSPGNAILCNTFGPTDIVSRSEMARWIVLAQMDEAQVTAYLNATGGIPGCSDLVTSKQVGPGLTVATCTNGSNVTGTSQASTFADPPVPASAYPGIFDDPYLRYIETMARRGYTKGCSTTQDTTHRYCPTDPVTRGQMAVFIIRAKMNNVFPTSLSGIPLNGPYGDNFGTFLGINPNGVAPGPNGQCTTAGCMTGQYFNDEPITDQFYPYIHKLRELRITNGTLPNADPAHPCAQAPCYSPSLNITRQEIVTFIVRAFFL